MKNRPRLALSQRSLIQTPNGIGLDVPTRCELGCMEPAAVNINGVRICAKHHAKALQIALDAPAHPTSGRHPETVPFTLEIAAA